MAKEISGEGDPQAAQPSETGAEVSTGDSTGTPPSETGTGDPQKGPVPYERLEEMARARQALEEERDNLRTQLESASPYLENRQKYDQALQTLDQLTQTPELAAKVLEQVKEYQSGYTEAEQNADPFVKQLMGRLDQMDKKMSSYMEDRAISDQVGVIQGQFSSLLEKKQIDPKLHPIYSQMFDNQMETMEPMSNLERQVTTAFDSVHDQLVTAGLDSATTPTTVAAPPPSGSGGGENVLQPQTAADEATDQAGRIDQIATLLKNGSLFGNK